jgi:hypothetical protein
MSADKRSGQYERVPADENGQDVVEMKKALATSPAKDSIAPTGSEFMIVITIIVSSEQVVASL